MKKLLESTASLATALKHSEKSFRDREGVTYHGSREWIAKTLAISAVESNVVEQTEEARQALVSLLYELYPTKKEESKK